MNDQRPNGSAMARESVENIEETVWDDARGMKCTVWLHFKRSSTRNVTTKRYKAKCLYCNLVLD